MVKEELGPACAFLLIFWLLFPIDIYVFMRVNLSICVRYATYEWFVNELVWGVWGGMMTIIGSFSISAAPILLWKWRKNWGQMVQRWKHNIKASIMPLGKCIPLKRKVVICLVWLYIILRLLFIVVYVMTSSDMLDSAIREMLLQKRIFCLLHYLSPTCIITLYLIGTGLFYLAVQVPLFHKDKMDSMDENA